MNSDHYRQQIVNLNHELMGKENCRKGSKDMVILSRNMTTYRFTSLIEREILSHQQYSPDHSSSEYHMLALIRRSHAEQQFKIYEEV